MPDHLVPEHLVDDVLDGRVAGDVADGVARVAELVGAARRPPSAAERSVADAAVASFIGVVQAQSIDAAPRSPRMIARIITAKTAAIAIATLCTAGAAAAATGTLPDPAQHAVSRAAGVVGLGASASKRDDGGRPDDHDDEDVDATTATSVASTSSSSSSSTSTSSSSTSTSSTSSTTSTVASSTSTSIDDDDATEADDADDAAKETPVGPDVTGPAKKGLCNAYLKSKAKGHLKNPEAVAFRNLLEGAAEAGQTVEEFCADVMPTASSTPGSASSSSSIADDQEDDESKRGNAGGNGNGNAGGNGNGNGRGNGKG